MQTNTGAQMRTLLALLILSIQFLYASNVQFEDVLIPPPPSIKAKSYVLMDATTGTVLAENNARQLLPPASLTKLMTLYVAAEVLKNGSISLEDQVYISTKAWKTEGSRMFLKPNTKVAINQIIHGVATASGNDASVALAEHIAGSEEAFASMMNQAAKKIGMKQSHFIDATGLPADKHRTTAYDLALLSQSFVQRFPDFYQAWFHDKHFEYNKIKQTNRNRLLWRHDYIDGIKTGHTKEAGHCLISSGNINNTRLISVVMGTRNSNIRDKASDTLLTYGFRFFETLTFHQANTPFTELTVWGGSASSVGGMSPQSVVATVPKNATSHVHFNMNKKSNLVAPIQKGDTIGEAAIELNGQTLFKTPIVAAKNVGNAPWYTRYISLIKMRINQWTHL